MLDGWEVIAEAHDLCRRNGAVIFDAICIGGMVFVRRSFPYWVFPTTAV
jgi:hypothetical protein